MSDVVLELPLDLPPVNEVEIANMGLPGNLDDLVAEVN